jgi:palmitoyl transferase
MCLRSFIPALLLTVGVSGNALAACDSSESILGRVCQHLGNVWEHGGNDLYIPFHTYHLRYAYTDEKIDEFREDTWGLGYGRSLYDESGNWSGLYGMAFLDSHSKMEPIIGYGHQWMWGNTQGWHAGVGYTAFITSRSDIAHYAPIPGILPIASVNYGRAALNTAFMPGGEGNGNILFFWSRFGF